MMEDELVRIWQSSPNQERVKFDTSRLMLEVQSGIDRTERMIKYRDLRETLAVVIGIPFFVYLGYESESLLKKIACGLIILYGIFVVFWLHRAKRHKPGLVTDTYLGYLRKAQEYLYAQKHLLDTALFWYILPGHVSISLYMIGSGNMNKFISTQVVMVGFSAALYYLNKRAAEKTIVPKLDKIETAIRVMEQETVSGNE